VFYRKKKEEGMMDQENRSNWFGKHVDTVIVLGGIITSIMWMNHKFSDLEKEISGIKTEVAVMKTVMIMQGQMPKEILSKNNEETK
jgi:hypothetical protein